MKKKTFLIEFLQEADLEVAVLRKVNGEPVSLCYLYEVSDKLRECDDVVSKKSESHEHEQ